MSSFIENLEKDYWQLTIPLVAAIIGWFTNWVAIKMMFHPLDFVGIKPFRGSRAPGSSS